MVASRSSIHPRPLPVVSARMGFAFLALLKSQQQPLAESNLRYGVAGDVLPTIKILLLKNAENQNLQGHRFGEDRLPELKTPPIC